MVGVTNLEHSASIRAAGDVRVTLRHGVPAGRDTAHLDEGVGCRRRDLAEQDIQVIEDFAMEGMPGAVGASGPLPKRPKDVFGLRLPAGWLSP
jgi:hypothetical protein